MLAVERQAFDDALIGYVDYSHADFEHKFEVINGKNVCVNADTIASNRAYVSAWMQARKLMSTRVGYIDPDFNMFGSKPIKSF